MDLNLITYDDLVRKEGFKIQKGMNFNVKGVYSIILMSVEKRSPYVDEILDDGKIKYEGHDEPGLGDRKKEVDQPLV